MRKTNLSYSTLLEKSSTNGTYTYKLALARARRLNALPPFLNTRANLRRMLQIYISAQLKNLTTKKKFHVDHIIPLCGVNVCGLHTPDNLKVISKVANEAKSNYFIPYVTDGYRKVQLPPLMPLPQDIPQYKLAKKKNPTKKSFKRRAKQLIFRKRDFR